MPLRLFFILWLVLGSVSTAAAQRVITLNPVTVLGEVVQAAPRIVLVKAGDGKIWRLPLDVNTRVKVQGTAVPETIVPNSYVRFIATIDKRTGKAQDKIDKITIFTPTQGIARRTPGVEFAKNATADDDDEPGQRMGHRPLPGQGPPAAGNAAKAADDEPPVDTAPKRGNRTANGAAAAVPNVASYEVCAQVVNYHSRRLTVNVQNRFMKPRITAELAPDAEISLDLSDLSAVTPGDKVSARGYYVTPGVCQLTQSLTITLANPLGEKPGRSRRTPPAAKSADTARRPLLKSKPQPAPSAPNPAEDEQPSGPAKPTAPKAKEKEEPPLLDDPDAKPQPKPADAKPDDSAEKQPNPKDDLKDVFEK